jgi:hypothetical protein
MNEADQYIDQPGPDRRKNWLKEISKLLRRLLP